jgi:hypothetical protein
MFAYRAEYQQTPGGVLATTPGFPGLLTCAATLPLARARLAGALEDLVRWYLSQGRSLPKPDGPGGERLSVMLGPGEPPAVTVPVPRT